MPTIPATSASANKATGAFRLKDQFRALGKVATVIPPLQPVVDLLAEGMDGFSTSSENHKDYEAFATNIELTVETLRRHLNHPNLGTLTESMSNTVEELRKQAEYISKKRGRSGRKRLMDAERDEADLMRCYRHVDALLQRLNIDVGMTVSRMSTETLGVFNRGLDVSNETFKLISGHLPDARLAELLPVKEARYDTGATEIRRSGCTPHTRTAILKELIDWANDVDGPKVYWMNGMAGTGKSTIAHSFCERLDDTNQLAASFFCSRHLPGCRDPSRIVPTIAYQLARLFRPYHDTLCPAIANNPDIGTAHVQKQFKKLIWEPLRSMKPVMPPGRLVFVVDALDECSDPTRAHYFADEFLQCPPDSPIKFFVTCRPDPILNDRFSTMGQASRSIFHLHDIEESLVQDDIETYLKNELQHINITEQQIKLIAKRSGKLFIYAATVVRYMRPEGIRVNSLDRLEVVLSPVPISSSRIHEPLDDLYGTIVSTALGKKELESWEAENIKHVLYTVLCAREPLSIQTLAGLLGLRSAKEAELAVEPLLSVLHVSDSHKLVTTLHASFPDFMLDHKRAGKFWCDAGTYHGILAQRCFKTTKKLLRFNICSLESSFVRDSDVSNLARRIKEAIPSHLFYACKYWGEHSVRAHHIAMHVHMLEELLANHILFWMEVMNLNGCIGLGASILSEMYGWLKRTGVSDDVLALCLDAQRFASAFGASPACASTPHIYVSILALWDRDSAMWTHYGMRANGPVVTEGPALHNRPPGPLVSWRTRGDITSAALSRDGRRVVASSKHIHELHVWDAYTGTLLAGPFIGHSSTVWSVAFSPDSSRIASASDDCTLRVWDAYTGCALGTPFEGHQSPVRCVAFSPDGSRLASGSDDRTIRIWDVQTGQTIISPFQGHPKSVLSIAYSPDGGRIASGSDDGTIYIWNAQTGDIAAGTLAEPHPSVHAIAFSPDGSHFISGHRGGAVRVWNAQTGQEVGAFWEAYSASLSVVFDPDGSHIVSGYTDGVTCVWDVMTRRLANKYNQPTWPLDSLVVAYLPNGYHIFSAFGDGTVCILDAQARQARPNEAMEQIGSPVHSVCFSPDSRRIAGGCRDGTICIWDIHTGAMLMGPVKAHTTAVASIAFSPDGSHVASGSWDNTICIWDTQAGGRIVQRWTGHSHWVTSVAYSPDGSRLTSGSRDSTICVWDSHTGRALAGPFKEHTDRIWSVAFSPNGKRIVSGSSDRTVRVWDAQTGRTIVGPLKGHAGWVTSVAFSPNNNRIVSGSDDTTIRVWNAQTGHAVGEPFEGHTDRVTSVAYSPTGSQIVSGSWDHTVRVWDAETGHTVVGPFKAHTHWVRSVAYSPDGSCFASGSRDGTIRIWRPQTDPDDVGSLDNWSMNEDGWIVGDHSALLCWVPHDLRPAITLPQNIAFIRPKGALRLRLKDACIGPRWTECCTR